MCELTRPEANILIDQDGHARLADFSLLTIALDQSTIISTWMEGGTIPWMSPELLDPQSFNLDATRPTKESDYYALGMVIYEVLSGQAPFASFISPLIIRKVLDGERPGRPQGEQGLLFTDIIWGILKLCWKTWPRDRTSAKTVLLGLEGNPVALRPNFRSVDGDTEADSDDRSDTTETEIGGSPVAQRKENQKRGRAADMRARSARNLFRDALEELGRVWRTKQASGIASHTSTPCTV